MHCICVVPMEARGGVSSPRTRAVIHSMGGGDMGWEDTNPGPLQEQQTSLATVAFLQPSDSALLSRILIKKGAGSSLRAHSRVQKSLKLCPGKKRALGSRKTCGILDALSFLSIPYTLNYKNENSWAFI